MTYKNDFESQDCAVFDLQFSNDRKAKNILKAVFVVLWPYLLTTKLDCLQKNTFGHAMNMDENKNASGLEFGRSEMATKI